MQRPAKSKPNLNTEPDKVVKYKEQRAERRRSRVRSLLLIVWGYAAAVWLYVIAMQLVYPNSLYWQIATWLPIRLDYFGESAFLLSFIASIAIVMWNARLGSRTVRHPTEPDTANST